MALLALVVADGFLPAAVLAPLRYGSVRVVVDVTTVVALSVSRVVRVSVARDATSHVSVVVSVVRQLVLRTVGSSMVVVRVWGVREAAEVLWNGGGRGGGLEKGRLVSVEAVEVRLCKLLLLRVRGENVVEMVRGSVVEFFSVAVAVTVAITVVEVLLALCEVFLRLADEGLPLPGPTSGPVMGVELGRG